MTACSTPTSLPCPEPETITLTRTVQVYPDPVSTTEFDRPEPPNYVERADANAIAGNFAMLERNKDDWAQYALGLERIILCRVNRIEAACPEGESPDGGENEPTL